MDEQELLPLSWLSQMCYCPRRAALLLNERLWEESSDTAKGRAEHQRVHTQRVEKRGDSLKLYEFTVFSDRLSLLGKCDCIEAVRDENGCHIPAADFPVRLYPVEYKHGTVRQEEEYQIQLCAQAMCLEEMFHTDPGGGIVLYFLSPESSRRTGCSSADAHRGNGRCSVGYPATIGGSVGSVFCKMPPLLPSGTVYAKRKIICQKLSASAAKRSVGKYPGG